jgi:hypothetical protein
MLRRSSRTSSWFTERDRETGRVFRGGIVGVPTSGITHRGENRVPSTRQGFGEQFTEASAGAGDENHLLGIHAATTSMPEAKYRNEFSRLLTGEM